MTAKSKKDQHRSAHMIRLPPDLYQAIQEAAQENDRPVTREIVRRLIASLEAEGKRLPTPQKRSKP